MEDITKNAIESLTNNLNNQMDEYLIEGLKRKGFEFNTKPELEQFIKDRCRCEDYEKFKEKIFIVDETPFLLWNYEIKVSPVFQLDREFKIEGDFGYYKYL